MSIGLDSIVFLDDNPAEIDLVKMTPQGSLCSTGYCLADNVAAGAEYLVYAPNGGSFTVNLSVTTHVLNVEWLNPSTGVISSGGLVTGATAGIGDRLLRWQADRRDSRP